MCCLVMEWRLRLGILTLSSEKTSCPASSPFSLAQKKL